MLQTALSDVLDVVLNPESEQSTCLHDRYMIQPRPRLGTVRTVLSFYKKKGE